MPHSELYVRLLEERPAEARSSYERSLERGRAEIRRQKVAKYGLMAVEIVERREALDKERLT